MQASKPVPGHAYVADNNDNYRNAAGQPEDLSSPGRNEVISLDMNLTSGIRASSKNLVCPVTGSCPDQADGTAQ